MKGPRAFRVAVQDLDMAFNIKDRETDRIAILLEESLLFKGGDFEATDRTPALRR